MGVIAEKVDSNRNSIRTVPKEDIIPSPEKTISVLKTITKIEADDDFDGIGAAIIARSVILELTGRNAPISFSKEKVVKSDPQMLVLDKTTDGDGWVVDHHHGSDVPKNYLAFCPDGTKPSGRLMYDSLPKEYQTETRLLLAAAGEIMDGQQERGERDGMVKEAFERMPWLKTPSNHRNQFLRQEELYTLADIITLLPLLDPQGALELTSKIDAESVRTADDLIPLCDDKQKEYIKSYFNAMENFPYDKFSLVRMGDYEFTLAREDELDFPTPMLARMEREKPGNYVLFKGRGLTVGAKHESILDEFLDALAEKFGENVKGHGGRHRRGGIQFKTPITYEQFREAIEEEERS